jgi:hypothetical protein
MLHSIKKLISTTFLFWGVIVFTQAQQGDLVITDDYGTAVFLAPSNKVGDLRYDQIKGSPYVIDTFQEAVLRGQEKVYLIRYDAFKGVIQFKEKGKEEELKLISDEKFYILDLVNKEQSYVVLTYPDSKKGFGLVIWNNKKGVELIKKQTITFEKAKNAKDGYGTDVPDSFSNIKEEYFIRLQENGEVVEIPSKKKDIFDLLGKEVEQRAKEEKLNPKKEEELIKLLDWKYTK